MRLRNCQRPVNHLRVISLKIIVLTLCLLCQLASFSQDILKSKTLAIVDTSKTKLEQAHEIYNWITHHISYDVDAYLKGDYSYKSPITILTKKKGICEDYSVLFNEMCYNAGIESYTVVGYVLSPDLFKGDGFYRANHSWNVVHIDSMWYLTDLTWGSGYLKHVPTAFDQIKYRFLKTPIVNRKWAFVKSPEEKYFNPIESTFERTHLPLDPKWQLRSRPFIIQGFEDNRLTESGYQINIQALLKNERGLSHSQQALQEGINGKAFNKKNDFDIGFGYLQTATEFSDQATSIDSLTIRLFDKSLTNYKTAKLYLTKYQLIIDSVVKRRIKAIKNEGVLGNKVVATIKRLIRSQESSYADNQNLLTKQHNELSRRIGKYESFRKLVSQYNSLITRSQRSKNFDSITYCYNLTNYCKSTTLSAKLSTEVDSLIEVCTACFIKDSILANKCLESKQYLTVFALNFSNQLVTEDNRLIFSVWDTIKFQFRNQIENFRIKRQNSAMIRANVNKINGIVGLMTEEFVKQVDFIGRMTKLSGDSALSVEFSDISCNSMIEAYIKARDVSISYQQFIERLMSYNSADYQLSLSLSGPPVENLRVFVKYDNELYASQKKFYENEKAMLKDVIRQCNAGTNRIEKRLMTYQARRSKVRK